MNNISNVNGRRRNHHNYAGGSADVKSVLGMTGVVLSRPMRTKIVCAIEYPGNVRMVEDRTEALRKIFRRLRVCLVAHYFRSCAH
jgi:hypothetical protein